MLLALAFLLLPPQIHPQAADNVSRISASVSVAGAPVSAEANSFSAASSPAPAAATPSASPDPTPAPAAAPAPVAYEPGMLTPVPVAASQASAIDSSAAPVSAGHVHFLKAMAFDVIDPQFENARDRHLWLGLSMAQSAAAGFDSWTTRREISSGQAQELNPLLKPFAGNDSLYVVMQVTPVILDTVAHHMMYSSHKWERRTWWVPQVVGTATSIAAGVHNLGVQTTPAQ